MGVVNKAEDQIGGAAVILILLALAVGVAIMVMGIEKFWPWLENAWKKIFGAVPEWLKPGSLSRWLAGLEMKLDPSAPLASVLAKSSKAMGNLTPGTADAGSGAQVRTGTTSGLFPGEPNYVPPSDSVASYGGE